jgi:hypothetical protein
MTDPPHKNKFKINVDSPYKNLKLKWTYGPHTKYYTTDIVFYVSQKIEKDMSWKEDIYILFFIANSGVCPPSASEVLLSGSATLCATMCRVEFGCFLTVNLVTARVTWRTSTITVNGELD